MFSRRNTLTTALVALIVTAALHAAALAQTPGPPAAPPASNPQYGPLIAHGRMMFQGMKNWLVASAEKMSEEQYAYKPTAGVRSYGQIVGHLADQNYRFCSLALGVPNPNTSKIEQTKTKRADLIAALKESLAYCDKAYAGLTDANALQPVKLGPIDHPRINLFTINLAHSSLHYGNLITYMRMNNITPPSSDFGGTEPPRPNR